MSVELLSDMLATLFLIVRHTWYIHTYVEWVLCCLHINRYFCRTTPSVHLPFVLVPNPWRCKFCVHRLGDRTKTKTVLVMTLEQPTILLIVGNCLSGENGTWVKEVVFQEELFFAHIHSSYMIIDGTYVSIQKQMKPALPGLKNKGCRGIAI